jgi:hypothetical protein
VRAGAADGAIAAAVIAGQVAEGVEARLPGGPAVLALDALAASPEDAFARAAELVEEAARRLGEQAR